MIGPLEIQQSGTRLQRGEGNMSDIANISGPLRASRILQISGGANTNIIKSQAPASDGDTVEISTIAHMLAKIRDLPDVRYDKVADLRRAIFEGRYDVDGRLDEAVEKLLAEIGEF